MLDQVDRYKRNYHPLIVLFYVSGILTDEQIKQIPRSTRYNWNGFAHENYDGYEWTLDYIKQFEDIRLVYQKKHIYASLRFFCKMSEGYRSILESIGKSKELLNQNAQEIITAISRTNAQYPVNVKELCRFYGISSDWYYRQRARLNCGLSKIKKCFHQHPNQLSLKEATIIENTVLDPLNFGKTLITLYYQVLRSELLFCGASTFRKYAHLSGWKKRKKIIKVRKMGLKASRAFEWLHVDVTLVRTINDGIQRVAFVKDNFSKAILHYKSTNGKADSAFIREIFQETFEKHQLFDTANPINILSDGGSENKGVFLDWINEINAPPMVRKITAKSSECDFSNSMAESTHSIYKTFFLKGKLTLNESEHLKSLVKFVHYFNFERFPTDLYGYNPMEVLMGAIPNKNRFKEQIAKAKIERRKANKAFNECNRGLKLCLTN